MVCVGAKKFPANLDIQYGLDQQECLSSATTVTGIHRDNDFVLHTELVSGESFADTGPYITNESFNSFLTEALSMTDNVDIVSSTDIEQNSKVNEKPKTTTDASFYTGSPLGSMNTGKSGSSAGTGISEDFDTFAEGITGNWELDTHSPLGLFTHGQTIFTDEGNLIAAADISTSTEKQTDFVHVGDISNSFVSSSEFAGDLNFSLATHNQEDLEITSKLTGSNAFFDGQTFSGAEKFPDRTSSAPTSMTFDEDCNASGEPNHGLILPKSYGQHDTMRKKPTNTHFSVSKSHLNSFCRDGKSLALQPGFKIERDLDCSKEAEKLSLNDPETFRKTYLRNASEQELKDLFVSYDKRIDEGKFAIDSSDKYAMFVALKFCHKFHKFGAKYSFKNYVECEKRILEANQNFSKCKYVKRTRKTTGMTIYDNVARPIVASVLGVDVQFIIHIEDMIEEVADALGILINGKRIAREIRTQAGEKPKAQTWNKKPEEVRFRLYAVVKRVLWNYVEFDGKVIEFLVKRLAYHIAQNKAKAKSLQDDGPDDGSKINKRYRKNILTKNPKMRMEALSH